MTDRDPLARPLAEAAADPVPADEAPPRPRRRRWITALTAGLALVAGWAGYRALTWPDVAALARENPSTTAFMERYQRAQRRAGKDDRVAWRLVPYAAISPHLKRAVLVAEDINFFSHRGFDTQEVAAALRQAWNERELPRGASTLTQQLAKNLYLSPAKTPLRKLEEVLLTRQLERHLPKRRILELYLNIVELGPGIYGAEAAARHYFGLSAAALSEQQAAQLAAALPRPRSWNPARDSRGYRQRVEAIRRRMAKAGWLWKEI
jgi:monofunctional biosynthetic peptidoglycan transglycosylase